MLEAINGIAGVFILVPCAMGMIYLSLEEK